MDGKELLRQGLEKTLARQQPVAVANVARTCLAAVAVAGGVVLGYRCIARYGAKHGVLVLSKQVPRGIGTVLGAGGGPRDEDSLASGNVRVLPVPAVAEQPVGSLA